MCQSLQWMVARSESTRRMNEAGGLLGYKFCGNAVLFWPSDCLVFAVGAAEWTRSLPSTNSWLRSVEWMSAKG